MHFHARAQGVDVIFCFALFPNKRIFLNLWALTSATILSADRSAHTSKQLWKPISWSPALALKHFPPRLALELQDPRQASPEPHRYILVSEMMKHGSSPGFLLNCVFCRSWLLLRSEGIHLLTAGGVSDHLLYQPGYYHKSLTFLCVCVFRSFHSAPEGSSIRGGPDQCPAGPLAGHRVLIKVCSR